MKEGGFFDPLGYQYNKEGKDQLGGYYDTEGYYVKPKGKFIPFEHTNKAEPLTQEEIESFEGHYDKDEFYHLKSGGFYDIAGFYFDKDGFDF